MRDTCVMLSLASIKSPESLTPIVLSPLPTYRRRQSTIMLTSRRHHGENSAFIHNTARMVQKVDLRCCGGLGRWICRLPTDIVPTDRCATGRRLARDSPKRFWLRIRAVSAHATRCTSAHLQRGFAALKGRPDHRQGLTHNSRRLATIVYAIGRAAVRDTGPACRGLFSLLDGTAACCSYLDDCAPCDNARRSLSSPAAESVRQRE